MKRICALVVVILTCSSIPRYAADTAETAAKIDRLMSLYGEYGLFSGAVLVSAHNQVILRKGYGLANREWDIPNTPDVKFRLGSITKQFTSMLVMQQVGKGTIALDGHPSDYLSYYRKDTGAKVTIHQLLNHTSGIPSYTDNPKFFAEVSRDYYAVDDFVKQFCSGDLEFEPGTRFHYDNSGYFILGAILEHVTGKPYDLLLKESILDPLGMNDTGYDRHAQLISKRAGGYQRGLGEVENAPYLEMALPYAAGSLYSTVDDLYKWDQALYTNRLLPEDLRQQMFTPGLGQYGYGWTIAPVAADEPGAGQMVIAHGGGINGFNTLEQRLIGDHHLIVLLNNTPGANLTEMARGIRAVLYGQEPKGPRRSIVSELGDTIVRHGVEAAIARYRDLKRTQPDHYDFADGRLNNLGSMLLQRNRTSDALAVLKLNAEEYPQSASVYDRLGEAYEKNGQVQMAIESYRKAVEIDPKHQHASEKVKTLTGAQRQN
jgi:CubicO group peptidase (beta-lactamase class C family)